MPLPVVGGEDQSRKRDWETANAAHAVSNCKACRHDYGEEKFVGPDGSGFYDFVDEHVLSLPGDEDLRLSVAPDEVFLDGENLLHELENLPPYVQTLKIRRSYEHLVGNNAEKMDGNYRYDVNLSHSNLTAFSCNASSFVIWRRLSRRPYVSLIVPLTLAKVGFFLREGLWK